jgi:hypothetical protein
VVSLAACQKAPAPQRQIVVGDQLGTVR